MQEKKKYLNMYLLQETKINRLRQMAHLFPERKRFYNAKIREIINLREEIENTIKSLDDDILCELLFQKYILGKTLEEISYILNYSKRHIERLHIKALKKLIIPSLQGNENVL